MSTDRSSVHGQTAIVPRSKSEPQKCTNNNFRLVSHCSFTRRFKTHIKIDGASDKRYERESTLLLFTLSYNTIIITIAFDIQSLVRYINF